jgi:hypothetical protein
VQVPLNYNWNGIAHAGEVGVPDAPAGFRSISDRALDFTAGVPNDPLLARYAVVATAGTLDMVHLGNRNTVDNGNWAFDPTPDNDDRGIQPTWLANANQTGVQTTTLAQPLPVGIASSASVLFHVSNGGGAFDVTFVFASGRLHTATLTGPDWYGGTFAGRERVDRATAGNNLNLIERVVDLSIDAGETLTAIRFANRSNGNAGYGIYGVNVVPAATPKLVHELALNYNWNGIVHAGEDQLPDAPSGYRSIASRGLDFRAGVPADPLLADFVLVDTPQQLDLVMLGNRNLVDGGVRAFDAVVDGDSIGVQPNWLSNPDLTGPQTTILPSPILLDAASSAALLYQSSGGGAFDVTFTFTTGSITTTLVAPDWVGGPFLGCADTDRAGVGLPLRIERTTLDLSPLAGLVLQSVTFGNFSNPYGSCAILAMNVAGCLACPSAGGAVVHGGGTGPSLTTVGRYALGCPLTWQLDAATPSVPLGVFAVGLGHAPQPLGGLLPGCGGTVHVLQPALVPAGVDAFGRATLVIPGPTAPGFCGVALTTQYAEFVAGGCPLRLSDAITVTIGN